MGVGALIGFAIGAAAPGALGSLLGMTLSWVSAGLIGASLGSLFDSANVDFGTSSPNYSFGPLSNSKTQLLPVPVVYGRCRVAGNVFMQLFDDDNRTSMDMFVGLSEGPISKVVRVSVDDNVLYGDGSDVGLTYWVLQNTDGTGMVWTQVEQGYYAAFTGTKEMRDSDGNKTELSLHDCTVDVYLGASAQAVDSREPDGFSYPNTAYVALTLKAQDGLSGNPVITSIVEGVKVWTPSGVVFSRNPAWIVYDILTNTRYGCGYPTDLIDLTSFQEAAAYCDATVDGGPRYQVDFIMDSYRPAIDQIQDILNCFQAFLTDDGGVVQLKIDRPESTYSRELTTDNFIDGSFVWWVKPDEERYNRLVIEWIDPDLSYERSSAVFEDQADIIANGLKETTVSLLGITNPDQVGRIAASMMEAGQNIRNYCSFQVSYNAMDVNIGDVVAITYETWNKKWFRVLSLQERADGTASLTCVEYDGDAYTAPGLSFDRGTDGSNTPAISMDDVHNLILVMEPRIEVDGTYYPDLNVSWELPDTFSPRAIEVRSTYTEPPDGPWETTLLPGDATTTLLKGLIAEKTAIIHVRAQRPQDNLWTSGIIGNILLDADLIAPGAPTNLRTEGWFGSITLRWDNPPDPDLAYIEIWEYHEGGLLSSDPDFETTAALVGKVNADIFDRDVGGPDTRWYWVRAVDASGNKSDFNLPQGTPGTADWESFEQALEEFLAQPEVADNIANLIKPVEDIRAIIINSLSDWEAVQQKIAEQISAKGSALANMEEGVAYWEGWQYHNAMDLEEKTLREEQGKVLAEKIDGVVAMIGDPENPAMDTVFAAVQTIQRAMAEENAALAQRINDLVAYIGNPADPNGTIWGAINTLEQVTISREEAISERVDGIVASIGDRNNPAANTIFAAIRSEQQARVSADSSQARATQTLQTQLNGNIASVQTLQGSVNGLESNYTVKTDVNGTVVGFGILNRGARGNSIVFQTDNFLIKGAGTNPTYPFFISGGRVYMNSAFIQDAAIVSAKIATAAIQSAHIRDASVDTLKIKGNAVTVPYGRSFSQYVGTLSGSSQRTIYSFSASGLEPSQPMTISATVYATWVAGSFSGVPIAVYVYVNGGFGAQLQGAPAVRSVDGTAQVNGAATLTGMGVISPGSTSATISIVVYGDFPSTNLNIQGSILAIHCKR